jgi:LPXTG-motif cell wall-anchored protein
MPRLFSRTLSVLAVAALAVVAPIALASPANAVGDSIDFTVEIHVGANWLPISDGTYPQPAGETYDARIAVTNIAPAGTLSNVAAVLPAEFTDVQCTNATELPGETLFCNGSFTVPSQIWAANVTVTGLLDGVPVELTKGVSMFGYYLNIDTIVTTEDATGTFRATGAPELTQLPLGFIPDIAVQFENTSNVLVTELVYDPACAEWPAELYPTDVTPSCEFTAPTPAANTPTTVTFAANGLAALVSKPVQTEGVSTYSGDGGCTADSAATSVGQKQTISCVGFLPGIEVDAVLNSAPVDLGPVSTGSGSFSFSFVVPASVDNGDHSVTVSLDGTALTTTPAFAVVPALAATGSNSLPGLVAGGAALVLGLVLFARSRKLA